jgi:hypothetical protein
MLLMVGAPNAINVTLYDKLPFEFPKTRPGIRCGPWPASARAPPAASIKTRVCHLRNGSREHGRSKPVAAERETLKALPKRRTTDFAMVTAKVTRNSTINVDRVIYSVPSRFIGHKCPIFGRDDVSAVGDERILATRLLRPTVESTALRWRRASSADGQKPLKTGAGVWPEPTRFRPSRSRAQLDYGAIVLTWNLCGPILPSPVVASRGPAV